jgi:hypothetical protein
MPTLNKKPNPNNDANNDDRFILLSLLQKPSQTTCVNQSVSPCDVLEQPMYPSSIQRICPIPAIFREFGFEIIRAADKWLSSASGLGKGSSPAQDVSSQARISGVDGTVMGTLERRAEESERTRKTAACLMARRRLDS